jgi:hypothetical protein
VRGTGGDHVGRDLLTTVIEGELAARFITIPKSSWTEEVQGLLSQACRDLVKADQAMQQFGLRRLQELPYPSFLPHAFAAILVNDEPTAAQEHLRRMLADPTEYYNLRKTASIIASATWCR